MSPSRQLKTKWFADPSFLLPCILYTNFFSWTSTQPIYIGIWTNHLHDPMRGFWRWTRASISNSNVHLLPPTIGKRMVLSTLQFPEIHCTQNLSKRTMLVGWRWSSAFLLCWWHPGYVKNKAGLWKILRSVEDWIQHQRARKGQTHTACPFEIVKDGISFSQCQCIQDILRTFSSHKGNKVYTATETQWTPRQFLESEDEELDPHLYREVIGSLMQLATWTTPDISLSISILSQFFSNPARRHWTLPWRLLNYLKRTQDS